MSSCGFAISSCTTRQCPSCAAMYSGVAPPCIHIAGGEFVVAGGEFIVAGGKFIVAGGELTVAGGEFIFTGGEFIVAGANASSQGVVVA
eukprot:802254-Prorocentrum_minimum.AAC.1